MAIGKNFLGFPIKNALAATILNRILTLSAAKIYEPILNLMMNMYLLKSSI